MAAVLELSETKRTLLGQYLRGERPRLRSGPPPITRYSNEEPAPLSFGQELIWVHHQLAPEVAVYNEPLTVHRHGPLDVAALERSLQEILRRHEAWRTVFPMRQGRPVQVVQPVPTIQLPLVDLRGADEGRREQEALALATKDARLPFDLSNGPLVRAALVRLRDEEYRLYLTLHHIIFDGISTYRVFLPELVHFYEAFAAGQAAPRTELPLQYADYARWQRQWLNSGCLSDDLDYWRRQLGGELPTLQLPTDRPRQAVQTLRGATLPVKLSRSLTEALKALSREQGVTPFMTLLATFKSLLHRYSGQQDIIVGTVTAGRKRSEIEGLLGFFLNPLALRTDLSGNPTFLDLLRRVRDVTVDALAHEDLSFASLVEELRLDRDTSRNPVFQVLFSLEPPLPPLGAGWDFTQMDVETGGAKFDLYLELDDRPDGIIGRFKYNTDLFDALTIVRMREHWVTTLERVVADPNQRLSSLSVVTANDRANLAARHDVIRPANQFSEFPQAAIEQSIPARFEEQVKRWPSRLAIKTRTHEWTFDQLNKAANRVARTLLPLCANHDERVALLFDHNAPMIAGMLGILKAGMAYVPLDPTYPRDRLGYMLEDAQASVLLTDRANVALAESLARGKLPIVNVDEMADSVADDNLDLPISPASVAYLLYTSGSTGRPKGVMQSHRNVLHFVRNYTNRLHLNTSDRLSLIPSYSFDAAVIDVYSALLNGASLFPISIKESGIAALAEHIRRHQLTIYHSTPTVYRYFLESVTGKVQFPTMRLVVLGGEPVTRVDAERFKQQFPSTCLFVNLAGQTESSLNLLYFVDQRSELTRTGLPAGFAVEDTEVLLLDEAGSPTDLVGEIAIRSKHVALSYWNRPELTAASFLSESEDADKRIYRTGDLGRLLPDGSVEILGRKDFQVKIRGIRVELGEIESVLAAHPAVREAVVVARGDGGEQQIVAYVVARGEPAPPGVLRRFLKATLPDVMVPSTFVSLPALPLTPNGKLDRRALPAPPVEREEQATAFVAPRTAEEQMLTQIWCDLLRTKRVGVQDDFFALGGHSLLAARMLERVDKVTGKRISLGMLFQSSTVERLAGLLRQDERPERSYSVIEVQANGQRPPLFCVPGAGTEVLYLRHLAGHLGNDQPLCALQAHQPATDSAEPSMLTVERVAGRFVRDIRSVQPTGPYHLAGHSFGGVLAYEAAQQLTAQGQQVALLALFDTECPACTENRRWSRLLALPWRLRQFVSILSGLDRSEWWRYATTRSQIVVQNAARRIWGVADRLPSSLASYVLRSRPPIETEHARAKAIDATMLGHYRPRPYSGRLTYFWAANGPRRPRAHDSRSGWKDLATGGIDTYTVPGDHSTMLLDPLVRRLAAKLSGILDGGVWHGLV